MRFVRLAIAMLLFAAPALSHAQDSAATKPAPVAEKAAQPDFITPHISDGHAIDIPWPSMKDNFTREIELPRWAPVHIGPAELDLSPTKHVVMIVIAAVLCMLTLMSAARSQARSAATGRPPKGFANGIEATVLYIRNEVILPNVGHHGEAFVPFLLTLFFFILFCNLLGLIPYGATATSNISVTATLAIVSFLVVEIAGMRALGFGYIKTIVYWPHDMALPVKSFITLIMTPVELIGKFTKPVALAIRLFANMIAGHVVILALISIVFTFGLWAIAPFPVLAATGIMMLEIFVAFLQAFVFCLLVSVFIGQIREGAH
ncbi:MAG TPA: F0F1 ATP synthase subunit A [Gemmatimonadaceae bacterium]|nr:F0F1 ATP synthase subunit A [Gemmatimonadaceae bacterium]